MRPQILPGCGFERVDVVVAVVVDVIFPRICSVCIIVLLSTLVIYHVISTESNMTSGTSKAHYAYSLGAPVLLNL